MEKKISPRNFGRKLTDRYYQLPQWVIKAEQYLLLNKNDLKLYLFFVSKADKNTRQTPFYSTCDLAERCKINRKYIRVSIFVVAAKSLIVPVERGHRVSAYVLYDPPPGLFIEKSQREAIDRGNGEDTLLNSSTLKAKPLNRRSPSGAGGRLSQSQGHFIPDTAANSPSQRDKMGQAPAWVTEQEPIETGVDYEPGADTGDC